MIDPDKDSLLLKLNYRNTRQILNFAFKFSKDFLQERKTQEHQADEDSIPMLAPEQAGMEDAEPMVKVWASLTEEAELIGHCITTWVAKGADHGMSLKDIAVAYTSKAVGGAVTKALSKAELDHRYLKNSYQKRQYSASEDKVAVLTRQSSKGLEFKTVILAGLGTLKDDEKHHAEEVRLVPSRAVGITNQARVSENTGKLAPTSSI